MISLFDFLSIFSFVYLWFGVLSLVVWGVLLLVYMKEVDSYFDSSEFPHRGLKGLWPWEMGRAASYGIFLLFPNSKFVRKKFPHARDTIKIDELPKKIKFIVAFPMYTYIPSAFFIITVGVFIYVNKWFF